LISHKSMAAFMVGNNTTISLTHDDRPQRTKLYTRQRIFKTVVREMLQVLASCRESGFIDQVGKIRTTHTRGQARESLQANFLVQRCTTSMHLQNSLTSYTIRIQDTNLAIKTTCSYHRFIYTIHTIR